MADTPPCHDRRMEQPSPLRPRTPSLPHSVDVGAVEPTRPATVVFAEAARVLSAGARTHGLLAPSFRTPPRLLGLDRTVRRHPKGGSIAVRVRGRPWPAVVADMIDGVVALNRLESARANRVRADLWDAVLADGSPIVVDGPTGPRRVA